MALGTLSTLDVETAISQGNCWPPDTRWWAWTRRQRGSRLRKHKGRNIREANFCLERIDAGLAERQSLKGFDCVVLGDVIEHLYRPADLLECASALLESGGYLIVGTPYHGYLKNLALSVFGKWDAHHCVDWDGGHVKFFSVKTLAALVQRHGFGDLSFRFFGRAPYLWMNMLCIARKL